MEDYNIKWDIYGTEKVISLRDWSGTKYLIRVTTKDKVLQYQLSHYGKAHDSLIMHRNIMLKIQPGELLTKNTISMLQVYNHQKIDILYERKTAKFITVDSNPVRIGDMKPDNEYTIAVETQNNVPIRDTKPIQEHKGVSSTIEVDGNKHLEVPTVTTTVQSPLKRLLLLGFRIYTNSFSGNNIKTLAKTRIVNNIIANKYGDQLPIIELDSNLDKKADDMEKEINSIPEEVDEYSKTLLLLLSQKEIDEHIYELRKNKLKACIVKYYN